MFRAFHGTAIRSSPILPAPMQRRPARLRSAISVLLAVLALAAGGAGLASAPASGPAAPLAREPGWVERAAPPTASAFLPGGGAPLEPPVRPIGPLTGVAPGRAGRAGLAIRRPPPLRATRPAFARGLAAARDGSLSARSTGLPPPRFS